MQCSKFPYSMTFVGEPERFVRNGKAERPSGCEVHNEIKFRWRLDWYVSRLLALEDAVHLAGRAPEPRNSNRLTTIVRARRHQTLSFSSDRHRP